MNFPENIQYSKEHTWILVENNIGTIGITEFAQSELGEIVFIDLPSVGKSYTQNEVFGSIEALKTVSDLFMPVAGEVVEINSKLTDEPSLVNDEPYTAGWLIKIKIINPTEISSLLLAAAYQKNITV